MEMRAGFHKRLQEIQDEVLVMGNMVAKALLLSIDALKDRDLAVAKKIIADDVKVNNKRFEIEEKCIQLIATQQPMAGDLRQIICMLSIVTEIERIGDYAEGIAKIVVMMGDEPPLKPLIDIPRMVEKIEGMLHRSLDALINRDADVARQVVTEDDEVDNIYNQILRELLTYMIEDPKTITRATRLIWVAHNLERSADRITNICERVVFFVTGKMQEIGASKY
ncbi:phosphate signaling complex protein PhoU [Chloroflexota bacterium]